MVPVSRDQVSSQIEECMLQILLKMKVQHVKVQLDADEDFLNVVECSSKYAKIFKQMSEEVGDQRLVRDDKCRAGVWIAPEEAYQAYVVKVFEENFVWKFVVVVVVDGVQDKVIDKNYEA